MTIYDAALLLWTLWALLQGIASAVRCIRCGEPAESMARWANNETERTLALSGKD